MNTQIEIYLQNNFSGLLLCTYVFKFSSCVNTITLHKHIHIQSKFLGKLVVGTAYLES